MSAFVYPASSGGGGHTSTVIWSVDFSTVADHDFKSSSSLSLGGVTFGEENASGQDVFAVVSGELVIEGGASGGYYGSTFTAPLLACDWSDLMALTETGAYDSTKKYVWRMIMSSGSPMPSTSGYEGPFLGIRRNKATSGMDCHLGLYQANYRAAKGGTTVRDNARGNTGTSTPRTFAVAYGQAGASWLVSDSDLTDSAALAGEPINAGYMKNDLSNTGIGITPVPDSLDLANAACQGYFGCLSKASGSAFKYQRVELHEVG